MQHRGFALLLVLVATWGLALGQEGQGSQAQANEEVAAWMKAAMPNAHHKQLGRLAGEWNLAVKMWMQPGAPPVETRGTSTHKLVLGGRFLQSEMTGNFMGMPFQGMAIDGYDNVQQKHTATWMDTMGTVILHFDGECSEEGNVRTMVSTFKDPMGRDQTMKGVTTIVSDDEHRYEAFNRAENGEYVKAFEIVYTRQ